MLTADRNDSTGVGLAALQIGKALGATVIATASSPEKLAICKKYGADHVVNYSGEPAVWQKEVMRITKGKGVDVVYDPVGMIIPSLKIIGWNGRIVVVGFAGGNIEKIPSNLVSFFPDSSFHVPGFWQILYSRYALSIGPAQKYLGYWSSLGKLKYHHSPFPS